MKTKRRFSNEFKLEAVKLMNEQGAVATAQRLGVGTNLLYRWRGTVDDLGRRGISNKTLPQPLSLEEENKQLRQEVALLREEKEILKKAAAYFAKHIR